jgi:hypothetical protein
MIRRAFLSGEFERLLRRLNPDLHVYCGDSYNRPAGLFLVKDGQIQELGGVDKNMVPDQTIVGASGMIVKKGWRATIKMLLGMRLVRPKDVQRLLPEYYSRVKPFEPPKVTREIDEAVNHFRNKRPLGRNGNPIYTRKDLLEIGDAFHG